MNVKAKVVKTEYDSLLEKYKRLTIGKPRANMADTVAAMQDEVTEVKTYPTRWSDAIALATQLITGNTGGYVILHEGPDGKPYELLIMDNPDINAAQNVWRWNVNGLGFSSSGYAGPYSTAITSNGMIVADFIQTGEIQDALGNNSWNLGTGVLTINNGKIQATYTHTYEYSDYSSSDISRITSIILHQVTPTDSDFEKYDIEGDGQIGPNDRNRIQQMINTSTSITKTITTTIDPSQNNKAISINIVVPAVGTAAAVNRTSFFAASQAKVNTVTCSNLDALNASVGAFCQGDAGAAKCINGADDYLEATDGTYTSKFASQLIRVATSGGDSSTIYRNGVVVTDTIKSLTYGLTGITFNDSYTTPKLYVIQRTQNSAGSQGVHLSEDGIYLAIVTRNNSSSASDTGVYVLQVRTSGNSSIREVVASSSTTLSISGDTLTFTTTNTYKTLTLIHITG